MNPTWDDVQKGLAHVEHGNRQCSRGCIHRETERWSCSDGVWEKRDVPFCALQNRDVGDGVCRGSFLVWNDVPEEQMSIFDLIGE